MKIKKQSIDVLVAADKHISLSRRDLESLKEKVLKTPKKRIRINIHASPKDRIHEMFIVICKDTYIRPHKHLLKKESYHVIEGRATNVLFDEKGTIRKAISMSDYASGSDFYYKLNEPLYHCLVIQSDYFVFVEVTNGPFRKTDNIFAPWSPDEKDIRAVKSYLYKLKNDIKVWLKNNP